METKVENTVKTSGTQKIKEGWKLEVEGACKIVAGLGNIAFGLGKQIQGVTQLPLDAVQGINSKIDKVKEIKKDIAEAIKELDAADAKAVEGVLA